MLRATSLWAPGALSGAPRPAPEKHGLEKAVEFLFRPFPREKGKRGPSSEGWLEETRGDPVGSI